MPRNSKLFLPFTFGDKMFNDCHLYASPRSLISYVDIKGKGKAIPLQAWTGPEGSRKLRLPDLKTAGT